jgi:chemotaxis signal transduction protein
MLKTHRGPSSEPPKSCPLVIFSLGGRRLAARAEEVGGVFPWADAMPVPSGTAFVNAIIRRGDEVLPVFDLASRLNLHVAGASPWGLIAKRRDGPIALRIDGEIPSLRSVEAGALRSAAGGEADIAGTCLLGNEEVPIYSLATLGLSSSP